MDERRARPAARSPATISRGSPPTSASTTCGSPRSRAAQAELARQYGIHGSAYYYYWFSGRRLLERPLEEVLASGEPDLPFCICWANENWTRRWDGLEQDMLIAPGLRRRRRRARFLRDVAPLFADPRYIRVDGKPLLLVYRREHLPDSAATVGALAAQLAKERGLGELH